LQSTDQSLFQVARRLGYPDGFTLSNQMERLVGVRPSVVRERLGWEWVAECWLQKEWETGGLRVRIRDLPVEAPHSDGSEKPGKQPMAVQQEGENAEAGVGRGGAAA
jgi:hypothetical protein